MKFLYTVGHRHVALDGDDVRGALETVRAHVRGFMVIQTSSMETYGMLKPTNFRVHMIFFQLS